MSSLASLAFGIVTSMGACVAVASVTSMVVPQPEGEKRLKMDSSTLWTSVPVRVDSKHQSLERLAPILSTYASERQLRPLEPRELAGSATAQDPSGLSAVGLSPARTAEHASWCTSHYRSYEPSSDTYRSYSGERRTCMSPFTGLPKNDAADRQTVSSATLWCASHYKSYRLEDNTFQPYDGPRQICSRQNSSKDMASID